MLKMRISPSVESPLSWQKEPANGFQRILLSYENLSIAAFFIFAIAISIIYKWYFGLILFAECFIIPSAIFGVFRGVVNRITESNSVFLTLNYIIYIVRPITLIFDIYLFYYLFNLLF